MLWRLALFLLSMLMLVMALTGSQRDVRKTAPGKPKAKRGVSFVGQGDQSFLWLRVTMVLIFLPLGMLSLVGELGVISYLLGHLVWKIAIVILSGGTVLLLYAVLMFMSMGLSAKLSPTPGRPLKHKRKNEEPDRLALPESLDHSSSNSLPPI